MGISGNLKTMVLAELLQWLSMGQKTGTLVIDNKKITKKVSFEGGTIISSASTDPNEYLGRFLINHGYIAEDLVNQAVARQKAEQQLLGQILVNMGLIPEDDLHQILRLKAEESIYDIFTWEEGDFEFLDNELPQETMVRMSLDVQWIVLEGSRRLDEWQRLREVVPSPLCVPVTVVDPSTLELDELDQRILAWIDDDRSIDDISQEAQTSLFQVASTVAAQVQAGTVKVVRPRIVEVEVEVPAKPGDTHDQTATQQLPVMAQMAPMQQPMPYPQVTPVYAQQPPPGYNPGYSHPGSSSVDVGGRTLHFAPPPGGAPQAQPAAPAPVSEAEQLVRLADSSLDRGDLAAARDTYRQAKESADSNPRAEAMIRGGEARLEQALAKEGISLSAVPKLKCGMDELTKIKLSPQEGFMLTRVDGSYDIKSILKMSPMPKLDALMLFWRLKRSGHVGV